MLKLKELILAIITSVGIKTMLVPLVCALSLFDFPAKVFKIISILFLCELVVSNYQLYKYRGGKND